MKVRIAGTVHRAKVLAPERVGGGRRAKLPKAARAALAERQAKVSVKVTVGSGGRKATRTVRVTVKAKAKRSSQA